MRRLPPFRLALTRDTMWPLMATLFLILWMLELEIWLAVWVYYSLFLSARWVWHHNPIGQTIDTRHAARERQIPAPYDPHGAPPEHIDLGQLGR